MVPSPSRALRSTATTLLPMIALILLVSPGGVGPRRAGEGRNLRRSGGLPDRSLRHLFARLGPVSDSFGASFLVINAILIVLAAVAG